MASQPEFKGFSLAGIKFAVVPGAFLLGPVFQDVSVERTAKVVQREIRKAETSEQDTVMKEFGLTWDSTTKTLSRDTTNTTNITLTDRLVWDEEGTKVVFSEGTMPKFTIDTGVANTLGGSSKRTLIVSSIDMRKNTQAAPITAQAEKLASKELPQHIQDMIQALPINKLIERADVRKFMSAMTQENGLSDAVNIVKGMGGHKGIPEFKRILGSETVIEKARAILNEIDEKLVGDVITRNFNVAKKDPKAFAEYKKLLLARGAKLPKGFSQETMKIGDIAGASFDKKGLRDQEIKIIANTTGIDTQTLSSADKEMIQAISGSVKLETQGSGYMSMARNRKMVQGARSYETGSYIMKNDLGLSVAENIKAIQKGMGNDLVKVALTNLSGRSEFASYKDAINGLNLQKVNLVDGRATVDIGNNRTLTIDLSGSRVFSALYGDTKMNSGTKEQAVCVNVAVLYEPRVAGVITDNEQVTQAPEMEVISSDTVMLPEVSTTQISLVAAVARKGGDDTNPDSSNDPKTKPGDGGEVVRPVTPQPVVTPTPTNPGVTPPSVNPGTVVGF